MALVFWGGVCNYIRSKPWHSLKLSSAAYFIKGVPVLITNIKYVTAIVLCSVWLGVRWLCDGIEKVFKPVRALFPQRGFQEPWHRWGEPIKLVLITARTSLFFTLFLQHVTSVSQIPMRVLFIQSKYHIIWLIKMFCLNCQHGMSKLCEFRF